MPQKPKVRAARGTRPSKRPSQPVARARRRSASPILPGTSSLAGKDDAFWFRALMDSTTDSIYFKDRECRLLRVNRQMVTNLGLSGSDEMIGKTDIELFGGAFGQRTLLEDLRIMEADEPMTGRVESRQLENGALNWTLTTKIPLHDPAGQVIGLVGITREINELKQAERNLEYLATHDMLTDLPNRYLMMDRLSQTLARSIRQQAAFAVVFVDIDGFKAINDEHGHDVGDQALRLIADRLRASVRASDTVARIGGDEFVIILEPAEEVHATLVAESIRRALSEPFLPRLPNVVPTLSMGIAIFPEHAEDADGMLRAADFAMYRSKTGGNDNYLVCPTKAPAHSA